MMQNFIITEQSVSLPIRIHHAAPNHHIIVPEFVTVTISGARAARAKFLATEPSLHLDALSWHAGLHEISITNANLLLPSSLRLVNYSKISLLYLPADY